MPSYNSIVVDGSLAPYDSRLSRTTCLNAPTGLASRSMAIWANQTTANAARDFLMTMGSGVTNGEVYLGISSTGFVSYGNSLDGWETLSSTSFGSTGVWTHIAATDEYQTIIPGDQYSHFYPTGTFGYSTLNVDSPTFSFACWIKISSYTNVHTFDDPIIFGSLDGWRVGLQDGTGYFYIGDAGGITYTSTAVPLNAWTHIACVWDGSTATFYIDGSVVASAFPSFTYGTSTSPYTLFGLYDTSHQMAGFGGMVDYAYVWTTAISSGDVSTMYAGGSPSTTSLMGEWHMAADTVNVADSSGNGNQITTSGVVVLSNSVPDKQIVTIYQNGVSTGGATYMPARSISSPDVYIATGESYTAGQTYTGKVWRPMLFARALTSGEVGALYACGTSAIANTIIDGQMLEGSGSTTADSSGNGNTLTLEGNATWDTDTPCTYSSSSVSTLMTMGYGQS